MRKSPAAPARELVKLRDNLYVPKNFDVDHHYFADPEGKKPYTGITSVLNVLAKPALIPWAARMTVEHLVANWDELVLATPERRIELFAEAQAAHRTKKEAAGAHGTSAHEDVETYIKSCLSGGGIPLEAHGDETIRPFIDWAVENVDHFLFAERRMAVLKDSEGVYRGVAGTADFGYVGKDGKKYLGDFKTSQAVYWEMWIQTAGYQYLAEEEGDTGWDGRVIVRLGKDGSFEWQVRYDYATDKECFLAALTLYRGDATYKTLRRTKRS